MADTGTVTISEKKLSAMEIINFFAERLSFLAAKVRLTNNNFSTLFKSSSS